MKNLILILLATVGLSSCFPPVPCFNAILPVVDFAILNSNENSLITSDSQKINLYAIINNRKQQLDYRIRKIGNSYGVSSHHLVSEKIKTFYLELEGKIDTISVDAQKRINEGCQETQIRQVLFNGTPAQKVSPPDEATYYRFVRRQNAGQGK